MYIMGRSSVAGVLKYEGFGASSLCEVVGVKGTVTVEGNGIHISSRVNFTGRGLDPCLVTRCGAV